MRNLGPICRQNYAIIQRWTVLIVRGSSPRNADYVYDNTKLHNETLRARVRACGRVRNACRKATRSVGLPIVVRFRFDVFKPTVIDFYHPGRPVPAGCVLLSRTVTGPRLIHCVGIPMNSMDPKSRGCTLRVFTDSTVTDMIWRNDF